MARRVAGAGNDASVWRDCEGGCPRATRSEEQGADSVSVLVDIADTPWPRRRAPDDNRAVGGRCAARWRAGGGAGGQPARRHSLGRRPAEPDLVAGGIGTESVYDSAVGGNSD